LDTFNFWDQIGLRTKSG